MLNMTKQCLTNLGHTNAIKNCDLIGLETISQTVKLTSVYENITSVYGKMEPPPDQSNHSISYNYDLN